MAMLKSDLDPFEHVIVAKEFTVSCKKSPKPPKSVQVVFNGENIPVTRFNCNASNDDQQVQQWALHDKLHVFSDTGDLLKIHIDYRKHKHPFKGAQEEIKLKASDIARTEQNAIVLSGTHFTVSLATRAGDVKDILETISLPELNLLQPAQYSFTSSDSITQFASSLMSMIEGTSLFKNIQGPVEAVVDMVGQTHPLAEAVVSALSIPFKILKNEFEFKENVKNLAEAMLATCKSLADARFNAKIASVNEVFKTILTTLRDAALYLELYRRKGRLQRIVVAQFSQKLQEYTRELITKKNEFQMAVTIQIARDVDMIATLSADDYLRKRLQPAEMYVAGEGCMDGTREKILDDAEKWVKDRDSKHDILWIKGAPGAGKTTIATSLVKRLDGLEHSLAVFFCKRDAEDLRNPRRVWPTMAYQFAEVDVSTKSALMSTLGKKENRWIKDSSPLDQFRKLVKDAFAVVDAEAKLCSSKRSLFVIVIDALDECYPSGDDRSIWNSLLSSLVVKDDPVTRRVWKLIVTSRPLADVQDVLEDASQQITLGTGDEVSTDSSTDIRKFFNVKFEIIRTQFRISPDWPGEDTIAAMTGYAGGLFIWADMGVKYVGQRTAGSGPMKRLEEILSDIGSDHKNGKEKWRMEVLEGGLDRLYARIIYDALRRSTADERTIAKRILATVVLAMSPLRKCDLVELFSNDDRIAPEAIESTLREFSTVISVSKNGALCVCHKTFSDFIQSKDNIEMAMKRILIDDSELSSFVIKGREEHRLACTSFARSIFSKNVLDVVKHLRVSRMLDYALQYWDSYLQSGGIEENFRTLAKAMRIGYDCLKRFAHVILSVEAEAKDLIECFRSSFDLVNQHQEGAMKTVKMEEHTTELDAARGEFQAAVVLRQSKDKDKSADAFLRSRLQPSSQSVFDSECLEGTRRDVLQSVYSWLHDSTKPNVLWLNGPPGAGKSTLATTLHKRITAVRKCVKVDAKRDFSDRRDPECMWRTIAYHLASLSAGLKGSIMEAVPYRPASVKQQYRYIVKKALEEQQYLSLVVIIDALDECSEANSTERKQFLQSLSDWTKLPLSLKLIVTSRLTRDIWLVLGPISLSIRLPAGAGATDEAKADTALFLHRSLEVNPPVWLTEALKQRAIEFSSGSFIHAKMIGRLLPKLKSADDLEAVLDGEEFGGNEDIDFVYGKLLAAIMGDLNEKERSVTRSILSTIALAKDPLHKADLVCLVPLLSEISCRAEATQLLEQVLSDLSVIVSSDDCQPIRIPHKSFVDFFLDGDRSSSVMARALPKGHNPSSYVLRYKEDNSAMAVACIKMMNASLKFNICEIESSYTLHKPSAQCVAECLSTGLIYACRFWAEHFKKGRRLKRRQRTEVQSMLRTFLDTHFLHWLEVLSATTAVGSARESLVVILQTVDDGDLEGLITDAIKFVLYYKEPISWSIPHIYLSALAFCPADSRISRIYGAHHSRLLSYNTTRTVGWPPDHDDWIEFSAYIDAERIIVSRGGDAFSWDLQKGKLAHTLVDVDCLYMCFSISPNGKLIATSPKTSDSTFQVWETDSGECLVGPILNRALRKGLLPSIAFSPVGSQFVVGWEDYVQVWNARDESFVRTLEGHNHEVERVSFSPDGRYIASADDSTIRIWDAERGGKALWVLTAHTKLITCLAFSPDGKYLATGSEDRTVRIWNTAQEFTENDVTAISAYSLSFSPKSDFLVAGTEYGKLFFWKFSSGSLQEVGQYFNNASPIRSVAFSPDGRSVLSSSHADNSVKIWTVPWVETSRDNPQIDPIEVEPADGTELQEHFALTDKCFIDKDGWVRDPTLGEDTCNMLFWIPPELRAGVWWPWNTAVFQDKVTKLDFSRFVHGRDWVKCRDASVSTS